MSEMTQKICVGLLAHVDAGKTTLSEALLYTSGKINHFGRVDHQDAYLDYDRQERHRKITIFAKQASFIWQKTQVTLLDTPGHIDFSSEMERVLQVLDAAVLVISSAGIQPHTRTIWQLLTHYRIPTLIFVNKMDMPQADRNQLLKDIQKELDGRCIDFNAPTSQLAEEISLCDDHLLETYIQQGTLSSRLISQAVRQRKVFPCYFGSALRLAGITDFLNGLTQWVPSVIDQGVFSARVFKIAYDLTKTRLTYMKILSGQMNVKDEILPGEKADQLRIYDGEKYTTVSTVSCGDIVAVKGLKFVHAGDVIGQGQTLYSPMLSSCMDYTVILPNGVDAFQVMPDFRRLSDEDPLLHIRYDTKHNEIRVRLMGEVQMEVLSETIFDRFGLTVHFDQGKILYKETITEPVLGVGHYEPLRHYAEVQLLLKPGKPGSGLLFRTACSEEVLDKHWQNLIMTHLKEKEHLGVLSGAPITDMEIILLAGKAHLKHTEGGDFRQATYRAVRQGLMMAKSVLLEPYYRFQATVPTNALSRLIYDIDHMHGDYQIIENQSSWTSLEGKAPVKNLQGYQQILISYTKGLGKMTYALSGYEPCYDQEQVLSEINYDPLSDLENPSDSLFCHHGSGYHVAYQEVYQKMHLPAYWPKKKSVSNLSPVSRPISDLQNDEETLMRIFERTYGPMERNWRLAHEHQEKLEPKKETGAGKKNCLIVDGYNLIHAWPRLAEVAKENMDAARSQLVNLLCNYQGYRQCLLILVFDAYLVPGNVGRIDKDHQVYIVYTQEAQTADMFIERTTHEVADLYQVFVVTSDALEQSIIIGQGAARISSREFYEEVEYVVKEHLKDYYTKQKKDHYFPLESVRDYEKNKKGE